ncbi:Acid ceramidase [Trichoplax sp. H2]|nr:Acid ceramidase [Trichoplax sp. H2]|eukprot:RDD41403.1 Acid ceramidase [Trichoplax sp. H2]
MMALLQRFYLLLVFLVVIVLAKDQVNGDVWESCETSAYPPDKKDKIEWYPVNLDSAPQERWMQLASKKKHELAGMIGVVKNFTRIFFKNLLVDWVDKDWGALADKIPKPYSDEIKGIAKAANIPLGEIVLYNIFYEIFSVCTSVVAQDKNGKIYHARNLDFGLFLGWDFKRDTWLLTEYLRPLVVNVDYQRNGKTVYKSVSFVGYVGVLTGIKPGVASVTINERFISDGGYIGLIEWVLGLNDAKFMSLLLRDTLDKASSYQDAVNVLVEPQLIAPAYFIVAGTKSGEGCVITRSREKTDNIMSLNITSNVWYVVETNYDNWNKPPVTDDRRTPAKACLNKVTQQHISLPNIYNVLSTKPVRNKLTTYTALMEPSTGHLESYRRYCADPCPLM